MTIFITGERIDEDVVLDDAVIEKATLQNCRLIYMGGALPTIKDVTFDGCEFQFRGSAQRTLQFLSMLFFTGASNVVEGAVSSIVGQPISLPAPASKQ